MPIVKSGGLLISNDGWPLTYPAWFSALDRRRIDDALSAASASATLPATPAIAPTRIMTGPLHGRLFASEDAALEALLQAFAVVVRVLSTPREDVDEVTRRRVADQLFDELVVWIADLTPSVTAGDFGDRGHAAREACAWWAVFAPSPQGAGQERSRTSPPVPIATSEPPSDVVDSPLLTLQEAAERLGRHDDTLKRMAERGELTVIRVGKRLKVPLAEVKRLLADPTNRYR